MLRKPTVRSAFTTALASLAALASGVALAACSGSGTPSAAPTVTVTKTATSASSPPAVSPQPPASKVPGGASTSPPPTPAPGAPAACPTAALSIRPGQGQGTAGSVYVAVVFRNISGSSCTLYGFPGVALAGGHPVAQIGLAAQRNQAAPRLVTLAPGAVASAQLQIVQAGNYPRSRCEPTTASFLQVYPPNQTKQVYVAYHATACRRGIKILAIGPVVAGPNGSA